MTLANCRVPCRVHFSPTLADPCPLPLTPYPFCRLFLGFFSRVQQPGLKSQTRPARCEGVKEAFSPSPRAFVEMSGRSRRSREATESSQNVYFDMLKQTQVCESPARAVHFRYRFANPSHTVTSDSHCRNSPRRCRLSSVSIKLGHRTRRSTAAVRRARNPTRATSTTAC